VDRRTAEYVAAVMHALPQVNKSAATGEILKAACGPLMGAIVQYEDDTKKATKAAKRHGKQLKKHNKTLEAIAYPQHAPAPRGLVNYRPADWETRMVPRQQPAPANGQNHTGEFLHDHPQQ
jgi:hypothetical protein